MSSVGTGDRAGGRPRRRRPYAARVPMTVRREQLLDAALRIIVRDGYARLSVSAIAGDAGVTRPVVYGAFDSLDTLLEGLLDRTQKRAVDQLVQTLAPLEAGAVDIEDWIEPALRALMKMVLDDQQTWRPILIALPGTPREVFDRIDASKRQLRAMLADLLRRSPQTIASGLDPEVVAQAVVACAEDVGRRLLDSPDQVDVEAVIRTARAIVRAVRS